MNRKQYVKEIVQRSCLPAAERKRLKGDLNHEIDTALERGESMERIIKRMGDPDCIAAELYANHTDTAARPFREYKSEKTLFGLPLVHIIRPDFTPSVPHVRTASARALNTGGRHSYQGAGLPAARGVFAFGPKATGVFAFGNFASGFIAIGNISAGILSVGNISAGLFSIGNVALALLFAMGNLAAGLLSLGNLALGYAAAGNLAVGEYAVGNETAGTFTFAIRNLTEQFEEVRAFLAGLNAPAPVKWFYGLAEKVFEIIIDPSSAIPLYIALFIVLLCLILLLYIVPHKLLSKNV
ncbi:MAG: hypothetical protein LBH95_09965 [Oscillospiraceae bacterium]|jgi:hypothetical protein|nr:hypothetical protein [Oscillospiraceae bacterium]